MAHNRFLNVLIKILKNLLLMVGGGSLALLETDKP